MKKNAVATQTKEEEQGRIQGKTVADSWAGAVMKNPLIIRKYTEGQTDEPTQQGEESRVFD